MMGKKKVKGRCIVKELYDGGSCKDIGWRLLLCDKAIFIKIPLKRLLADYFINYFWRISNV